MPPSRWLTPSKPRCRLARIDGRGSGLPRPSTIDRGAALAILYQRCDPDVGRTAAVAGSVGSDSAADRAGAVDCGDLHLRLRLLDLDVVHLPVQFDAPAELR